MDFFWCPFQMFSILPLFLSPSHFPPSQNPHSALAGRLLFPRYTADISPSTYRVGEHSPIWESPWQSVTCRLLSSGLPVHTVKLLRSYEPNGRDYIKAAFRLNHERAWDRQSCGWMYKEYQGFLFTSRVGEALNQEIFFNYTDIVFLFPRHLCSIF